MARSPYDQRPQPVRSTAGSSQTRRAAPGAGRSGFAAYAAPVTSAGTPSFQKGDTVRHKAFGRGMILSIQKMGGDALAEIAFDEVGTKRLMLKSAAAHMEKL